MSFVQQLCELKMPEMLFILGTFFFSLGRVEEEIKFIIKK